MRSWPAQVWWTSLRELQIFSSWYVENGGSTTTVLDVVESWRVLLNRRIIEDHWRSKMTSRSEMDPFWGISEASKARTKNYTDGWFMMVVKLPFSLSHRTSLARAMGWKRSEIGEEKWERLVGCFLKIRQHSGLAIYHSIRSSGFIPSGWGLGFRLLRCERSLLVKVQSLVLFFASFGTNWLWGVGDWTRFRGKRKH